MSLRTSGYSVELIPQQMQTPPIVRINGRRFRVMMHDYASGEAFPPSISAPMNKVERAFNALYADMTDDIRRQFTGFNPLHFHFTDENECTALNDIEAGAIFERNQEENLATLSEIGKALRGDPYILPDVEEDGAHRLSSHDRASHSHEGTEPMGFSGRLVTTRHDAATSPLGEHGRDLFRRVVGATSSPSESATDPLPADARLSPTDGTPMSAQADDYDTAQPSEESDPLSADHSSMEQRPMTYAERSLRRFMHIPLIDGTEDLTRFNGRTDGLNIIEVGEDNTYQGSSHLLENRPILLLKKIGGQFHLVDASETAKKRAYQIANAYRAMSILAFIADRPDLNKQAILSDLAREYPLAARAIQHTHLPAEAIANNEDACEAIIQFIFSQDLTTHSAPRVDELDPEETPRDEVPIPQRRPTHPSRATIADGDDALDEPTSRPPRVTRHDSAFRPTRPARSTRAPATDGDEAVDEPTSRPPRATRHSSAFRSTRPARSARAPATEEDGAVDEPTSRPPRATRHGSAFRPSRPARSARVPATEEDGAVDEPTSRPPRATRHSSAFRPTRPIRSTRVPATEEEDVASIDEPTSRPSRRSSRFEPRRTTRSREDDVESAPLTTTRRARASDSEEYTGLWAWYKALIERNRRKWALLNDRRSPDDGTGLSAFYSRLIKKRKQHG